ncbi:MAG TPA: DUF4405 domain-containing protein [Candidatus Kapabacteria bacterium]|nr:DUF4405 domain-containing protein [Candidatus Kapabacteria bacterium]HPO62377.1 DUF4405 domain-containing protein [Candidatus Kapabacteria bacterium]
MKSNLKSKALNRFIINNLLLVTGLITIISGLVLQLGFHMGNHHRENLSIHSESMAYEQAREINPNEQVWGFSYSDWSTIHKTIIIIFSVLMIYHFCIHWKWYKGVFTKHLIGKHQQVIVLTMLFLIVAITGIVPWIIDLSGGTVNSRTLFIEIHDKITFVLIVYFILHIIKRTKWYSSTFKKFQN